MAYIRIPDVREIYFQHKTLTRVVGQPHFSTFRVLRKELKANGTPLQYILSPLNLALKRDLSLCLSRMTQLRIFFRPDCNLYF